MSKPVRLRLSRAKGFNLQALSIATNGLPAVNCARPSKWGNPFSVSAAADVFDCRKESAHGHAVRWFREWIEAPIGHEAFGPGGHWEGMGKRQGDLRRALPELRGKNLACYCRPDLACHCDALLELASARP